MATTKEKTKKKDTGEAQEPAAEQPKTNDTTPVLVVDKPKSQIEKIADKWLEKSTLSEKAIAQWKQDYTGLKITGIEDKEGLEKVKEAKKHIQGSRTALADFKKEKKAPIIAAGKKIDADYNKYIALLEEIEAPLDKELDEFKRLEKEEAEREEKEATEKLEKRIAALKEAGIMFDGEYYTIGEISIDATTVKKLTEEKYEVLQMKVKLAGDKAKKEAEEKRLQEAAEAEKRRLEDEARAAEQKKLDDDKAEAERQRKELEEEVAEMKRQKILIRQEQLEGLGMSFSSFNLEYHFSNGFGKVVISAHQISELANPEFATAFASAKTEIVDLKQKQADKEEEDKKALEAATIKYQLRVSMLHGINMLFIPSSQLFVFHDKGQTTDIYISDKYVKEFSEEDFNKAFDDQVSQIEAYRKKRQEAEEAEATERARQNGNIADRVPHLIELGMKHEGSFYVLPENTNVSISQKFIAEATAEYFDTEFSTVKELARIAKERIAQAEADSMAQAEALKSEAEKLQDYVSRVRGAISVPHDIKNAQFRKLIDNANSQIYSELEYIQNELSKLA